MLCGGGEVPVFETFVLLDLKQLALTMTSRDGDVPVDFFWTCFSGSIDTRLFSRGGDGPTEMLCSFGWSLTGESLMFRRGESWTLLSIWGDDVIFLFCWEWRMSRGGDGPTAISCPFEVLSTKLCLFCSITGDWLFTICIEMNSSLGGDGPQPVDFRSLLILGLHRTPSGGKANTYVIY